MRVVDELIEQRQRTLGRHFESRGMRFAEQDVTHRSRSVEAMAMLRSSSSIA
jgi:hypothetical protein